MPVSIFNQAVKRNEPRKASCSAICSGIVHHDLEAMHGGLDQLLGVEYAFEQNDGPGDAGLAQHDAFLESATARASACGSPTAVMMSPWP